MLYRLLVVLTSNCAPISANASLEGPNGGPYSTSPQKRILEAIYTLGRFRTLSFSFLNSFSLLKPF